MKKVTKQTVLADLIGDQKIEKILAKHKVPCLTCPFAQQEMAGLKLGDVCQMYGLDAEKLLIDLNKINKK